MYGRATRVAATGATLASTGAQGVGWQTVAGVTLITFGIAAYRLVPRKQR